MRVEGQLILNSLPQRIDAAEAGLGPAYVPDDCVAEASQRPVGAGAGGVDPAFPGYHLITQPAPAYQRFHAVTGNLRR
ncbi:HTH-type transcriptional regulator PgrR [Klebsiella pneumoniae]|nr:HTH-type transcriptional regulator PgrR [Klebsiella pneumoniae]